MLIDLSLVQKRFPRWKTYCTLSQSDTEADAEARLTEQVREAEGELLDYVAVEDGEELSERMKRHLLNIVRFNCHDLKYGSEDYDTKPTAVRRYEGTIETLRELRAGQLPAPYDPAGDEEGDSAPDVKIDAEPRRFRESWLTGC